MFIQTPNNLSSLYSELKYTYQSSSTADMTIQIYEDETDELLGVKKFYSTSTACINIAPHIRPYAMPTIDSYLTGFITPYRNCNLSVYLKVSEQNATSTTRQFTLSRGGVMGHGLISSLPSKRVIAAGEAEQFYIAAESGDEIAVVVNRYLVDWSDGYQKPYLDGAYDKSLISTQHYNTAANDGSIEIFNFVAESSKVEGEQVESVEIEMLVNSELVSRVEYLVVERPAQAIRLAWIAESGSIEHYTFPAVKESSVDMEHGVSITLSSAFEGCATRAALAEIVRSEMVWISRNGGYERVTPLDSSLSVASNGALGTVNIKISCND